MMVAVEQSGRDRRYRSATWEEQTLAMGCPFPADAPTVPIDPAGAGIRTPGYGLETQADLYIPRQLAVLDAFAGAVAQVKARIERDGGSEERALAVAAVLGLCVGKLAQHMSTQVRWLTRAAASKATSAFGRNDLPMTWDFAECNAIGGSVGDWTQIVDTSLRALAFVPGGSGKAVQCDAQGAALLPADKVIVATDPPYFDQIGYADLADYFYVWLRRALRGALPDLFGTLATPKKEELTALPSRHGGKEEARRYFIDGFRSTFESLKAVQHGNTPMLVIYAFKEQGTASNGHVSTGWAAILEAMIGADLTIVATWPIHATGSARMRGVASNALATYVLLVCQPRAADAPRISRNEFVRLLRSELADATVALQHANIAPVDLAQAVIGPGMEVYSRHRGVVESDGTPLDVEHALTLINRSLAEVIDEQEGDLDPESRWAVTWYEQHGFSQASFGDADQLARAKGIAVDALVQAGIVRSAASHVALLGRETLPPDWDPLADSHPTAWEAVQHLVRALDLGGELAAAALFSRLGGLSDPARELAYRLFHLAEKTGRIEEAIAYNSVVATWPEFARLAQSAGRDAAPTEKLF